MQRRRHLVVYVPSVLPNIISFSPRRVRRLFLALLRPIAIKMRGKGHNTRSNALRSSSTNSFSRCKGRVELEMNLRTLFFFVLRPFITPLYVQFCVDAALTRHDIHTGLPAPWSRRLARGAEYCIIPQKDCFCSPG